MVVWCTGFDIEFTGGTGRRMGAGVALGTWGSGGRRVTMGLRSLVGTTTLVLGLR